MSDGSNRWDAGHYDGEHAFVYEYGADLLGLLAPEPGERILDLGCGTGHLTAEIADAGAAVLGVDRSPSMVREARAAYPDIPFARADARSLPAEGAFDAAFSNAALHWIPEADHDAVLSTVREALVPGGRFVAEMGGRGNVAALVDATVAELAARGYAIENPWYFPAVGEYTSRIESHGFEVTLARLFDRPTELEGGPDGLRNWLGMFGDSLLADVPEDERDDVLGAVEDWLREEMYDPETETWTADYRRLRFVAVRTDG